MKKNGKCCRPCPFSHSVLPEAGRAGKAEEEWGALEQAGAIDWPVHE